MLQVDDIDVPLRHSLWNWMAERCMKAGFLNLYGYTSDDDGIRHAILEEPAVGFDEAKFMLVSCSAFADYLISKADAAGLLRK